MGDRDPLVIRKEALQVIITAALGAYRADLRAQVAALRQDGVGMVSRRQVRLVVTVEWVLDSTGVPGVTDYSVRRTNGEPIPPELRAQIEAKVDAIADALQAQGALVLPHASVTLRGLGRSVTIPDVQATLVPDDEDPAAALEERFQKLQAKRRRRKLTPELLAEVAEVYKANPQRPTKAVAAAMGDVSPAQASRYVKAARDAGLIPPREES